MEGVKHRMVEVNGIKMHVAEKGEGDQVVLFLHGYPELWYSWRHQILAAHGYKAVAPDLRGFGDTDAPTSVTSYTYFHIVGDLIALIDNLCVQQESGVVEGEYSQAETRDLFKHTLAFRGTGPICVPKDIGFGTLPSIPETLPSWLTEDDITYYATKYDKKGCTGGLNYYRALDLNWEVTAPWTGAQVKVPTKFIVGNEDLTYTTPGAKEYIHGGAFKKMVPMLEEVVVMEGVAHFINQEKADDINQHILNFIQKF